MNKAPAFQFYVNDWLSSPKIMLMTPAQEGAYVRLLCIAWGDPDCSIPDDDNQLAILSRLAEGWFNGGSTLVRECFEPHPNKPGRLVNLRLLEERRKQEEWREKSKAGGIKSGQVRQEKALIPATKQTKGGSRVVKPKANSSSSPSSSDITEITNVISGAGALTEPAEPPVEKPSGRKPDPLFHEFCSQFETTHEGQPYAYKPADFVKLSELRDKYAKAQPKPWEITLERFKRAAEHYFASELATHTLADLCERFSTFWPHAIDRFNKPIGENGRASPAANGNGTHVTPPVVSAPANYRQPKLKDKGDTCDSQT